MNKTVGSAQIMGVREMRETGLAEHMLFQITCDMYWSDFFRSAEIKIINRADQTNKIDKNT